MDQQTDMTPRRALPPITSSEQLQSLTQVTEGLARVAASPTAPRPVTHPRTKLSLADLARSVEEAAAPEAPAPARTTQPVLTENSGAARTGTLPMFRKKKR